MTLRIMVIASACLAAGCQSYASVRVETLPAWAMATESRLDAKRKPRPKLLERGTFADRDLGAVSPYARMSAESGALSRADVARSIWRKGQEIAADVVVVDSGGSELSMSGVAYRENPSTLGFSWDDIGIVDQVSPEAVASGLRSGDRILSIGDFPVVLGPDRFGSGHFLTLLSTKPGESVLVVWHRRGQGQMQGRITAQPNTSPYRSLPDSVTWER